jgi:hypothetical protein
MSRSKPRVKRRKRNAERDLGPATEVTTRLEPAVAEGAGFAEGETSQVRREMADIGFAI